MPQPGIDVEIVEFFQPGEAILDMGQGMFAGYTERGPNLATLHNMADYRKICGGRNGASKTYDGVSSFFDEGGTTAYVARNETAVGVVAEGTLGTWADFAAKSQGVWGNDIDVTIVAGVGAVDKRRVQVSYQNAVVETSPNIVDVPSALAWLKNKSNYVEITGEGADSDALPDAGTTVALAAGVDGAKAAGDYQSGLDRLVFGLGPGQVNAPGESDPGVQLMVGQHVVDNHRVGCLDFAATEDPTVLASAVAALYGQPGARQMIGFGNWLVYPSDAPPATNLIPYSGAEMGMIALVEKKGDASLVAAGSNAISRRAEDLNHRWSNEDHKTLNGLGVTLGRVLYNNVRTYGYRTVAGPDDTNWLFFQEARVIMSIAHALTAQLEEYVFDSVDGLGHFYSAVKNAAVGVCLPYWIVGALYGGTADQAFRVVVNDSNNPPEQVAMGEIHVTLYLRTSKIAEWLRVEIIKVPTSQEVPA